MGRRWDCRWGERMGLRCKGCGGEEHVKNGFVRGKQRYRCKACGLNFPDTPPRGMPLRVKVEAVLLYLRGRLRSQGTGSRFRFGWARRCSMSRIMASLTMVSE